MQSDCAQSYQLTHWSDYSCDGLPYTSNFNDFSSLASANSRWMAIMQRAPFINALYIVSALILVL